MSTVQKAITLSNEQENEAGIASTRVALIEGEDSGEPQPFDVGEFKRIMLESNG